MDLTEYVSGAQLIVGPDQTYTTIQSAINAASSGDTIRIYDGTYSETITIGKTVTIEGNGSATTVVKGSGTANLITVTANNVNIKGLTVTTGTTSGSYSGIYAASGINNLKIENCNFTTCYYGLRVYASSSSHSIGLKAYNSTFYNNYYHLYTYYNDYDIIRNNTFILGDYYSIYNSYSHYGVIENNRFLDNDYGIRIYYSNYNKVANNSITNTEDYGLDLYTANYNKIWNNTVDGTLGNYGVYYYNSDYNYFEKNTIKNAGSDGIYFSGADYNEIHNNSVSGSLDEAFYHSSGGNNNIQNNSFTGSGYYLTSTTSSIWSTNRYNNNKVNGRNLYIWYMISNRAVSNAGQVLLYSCNNINITNQNLSDASIGVVMIYSSGCWVMNNTMNDNYYGAYVYGSSTGTYYNNIFRNNTIRRTGNYGLYLYYMDRMRVESNKISHTSSYGVYHYYGDYNTIRDNVISYTDSYGFYLYYSTNNVFDGNEISRTSNYGVYSYYSTDNQMRGNRIQNTTNYGLYIYASSSATAAPTNLKVQNNTISDTLNHGIYINYGKNSLFRDNLIKNTAGGGIYLSNADLNDINNNTLSSCGDGGLMIGSGADSNNIRNNIFLHCGMDFSTTTAAQWTGNSIASTNTVNGRPIYLRTNTNNLLVPPNVGQVFLYNCHNARISGARFENCTTGVFLNTCNYVTIQNCFISNGTYGLQLMYSDYTRVNNNTIKRFGDYGIYNYYSDYTHVFNNTISDSGYPFDSAGSYGVYYNYATDTYTENNTFKNCGVYIYTASSTASYWTSHRMSNNTVNGRDLKFFKSTSGQTVDGTAGQVIILNSNNITVRNCDLSRSSIGVMSYNSVDIIISNITADHNYYGVFIYGQYGIVDRTSIMDSDVSYSAMNGIRIYSSSSTGTTAHDVVLAHNNASNCGDDGIYLYYTGERWRIEDNVAENNEGDYGIYFYTSSSKIARDLIFRNNKLNRNYYGAYIYYADYSLIENNSFSYNTYHGLYAYYCDYSRIANNTANSNVMYGIYAYYAIGGIIDNNKANNNQNYGIYAYYADGCVINRNQVNYNQADGIYAYYCDPTTITNNTANLNTEDGIYAYYCDLGLNVKYNTAIGNGFSGIEVYRYGNGQFTGNNASENSMHGLHLRAGDLTVNFNIMYMNKQYGIKLEGTYAVNMKFLQNRFTRNNMDMKQAYDDVGKNQWDDGSYGNYWSDWTSPDLNQNGIVDYPYTMPGPASASDRYPLIGGVPIIIPPSNLVATEDAAYSSSFSYFGVDPPVTWSFRTNAGWITTGSSPTIYGTPSNDDVGTWWVEATASMGTGVTKSNVTITVTNVNDDPKMNAVGTLYADEDSLFWKVIDAIDVDPEEKLTYSLRTNATFLSINSDTGNVSGTPRNSDLGSYFVEVTVRDLASSTDMINTTLIVINTNDDPVITTSDVTSVYALSQYSVDYDAIDEDPTNDILTWTLKTNATFLSINSNSGVLAGSPTNSHVGSYWVNVTVSDGIGGSDWTNFTLQVLRLNTAPAITTTDITTAYEDAQYSVDYDATDPDTTDVHTWYLNTNASFLRIAPATGVLSGDPTNRDVGTYWVNVSVSDGNGGSDWSNFTLRVLNVNDDPTILNNDVTTAAEDSPYNVTYQASDEDPTNDRLTWSVLTDAGFLSMDIVNGWLTGTPTDIDVGLWWVNVSVSDGNGGSDWSNFTLRVTNINDAPVITNAPWINSTEDIYFYFDMEFTDDDPISVGEVHSWSLTNAPAWMNIDQRSGEIFGTPRNGDVRTYFYTIVIDDGTSRDTLDVTLTVQNAIPRIVAVPSMVFTDEDASFSLVLVAVDDYTIGETFEWTLMDGPGWLDIDPSTGELYGIPANSYVGVHSVNVTVSDTNGGTDRMWFNITVQNVNDAPDIFFVSIPTLTEDIHFWYLYKAIDVDPTNDVLTWEIFDTNAHFLSIDPNTGNLSGTPSNDDVGEWWVVVRVSDGKGGEDESNVTLTVMNTNDDPVISTLELPQAVEDSEYWYVLSGADIDPTNDSLLWSIEWTDNAFLEIDPETGNITGLPMNDDVGTWWVLFNLSDRQGGWSLKNLSITVVNQNDGPIIITSELDQATEDTIYSMVLQGEDIDPTGDVFEWSMSTDASFLMIDTETGELYGTPGNDDVGLWWVLVNLSDGRGGWMHHNFSLIVVGVNDGPMLNITGLTLTGNEDGSLSIDLRDIFTDPEGDQLSFTFTSPENLTVTIVDGVATIVPKANWEGEGMITLTADDGEFNASIDVGVRILGVNDPPFGLSINALSKYVEGGNQIVTSTASDPDLDFGDSLTFTWYSNVSGRIGVGQTINLSLGAGFHLITLNVTDSSGLSAEIEFQVEVTPKEEVKPSEPEQGGFPWWVLILAGLILIIIIVVVLVLIRRRKPKEETAAPPSSMEVIPSYQQMEPVSEQPITVGEVGLQEQIGAEPSQIPSVEDLRPPEIAYDVAPYIFPEQVQEPILQEITTPNDAEMPDQGLVEPPGSPTTGGEMQTGSPGANIVDVPVPEPIVPAEGIPSPEQERPRIPEPPKLPDTLI